MSGPDSGSVAPGALLGSRSVVAPGDVSPGVTDPGGVVGGPLVAEVSPFAPDESPGFTDGVGAPLEGDTDVCMTSDGVVDGADELVP